MDDNFFIGNGSTFRSELESMNSDGFVELSLVEMTEVMITDEGGASMESVEHNGYIFPSFNTRTIVGLSSVKIRKDDILLLAFPKSGNHWLWEICRQILAGRIIHDDVIMTTMFMDRTPEESYADIPSPRVLTSHTRLQQLPPDLVKIKPKIISILRNPKDIAASLYPFMKRLPICHYSGKWEDFLKSFVKGKLWYGSWMDYILAWEKVKADYPDWPVLSLYYEDLLENPLKVARKLCSFLNVERSDEFLEEVCRQCSFDSMRKLKSTTEHKSLYFRKGQVGDWKNWFTVAQSEWFDHIFLETMKECPVTLRYSPN